MKPNGAFIVILPVTERYETVLETPVVNLIVVGVQSYEEAVKAALELVNERGVAAIELCAGFGHRGVAMVSEAVGKKAAVGVVRFDHHPAIDNKSGDTVF